MRKLLLVFLLVVPFLLFPESANATIFIQRTGARTYRNIQTALNSALPGDRIILSRGTYIGSGNGHGILWPNTDNLSLAGAGPNETVISAESLGRVMKVLGSVNLTIEGVTIKDGGVNGNGAGVHLPAKSSLRLKNVVFKGCVTRGRSILAGTGSAVNSPGSYVNARKCSFINNTAAYRGGVAYGGTWEAYGCTFSGNRATSSGGVVYEGNWKVESCVFNSNVSVNAAGVFDVEKLDALNCVFYSNKASYGGVAWGGSLLIRNCTMNNNISQKGSIAYTANCDAINSIFWGSNNQFDGGSGTLKYCDVQGGFRSLGLKECITSNPRFREVSAGDFHLLADSRCIDSGTFEGAPETDIDGNERPYPAGSVRSFDIGAYEFRRPDHDLYVSPAGKDNNSGKADSPLRSLQLALAMANNGRAIYLKNGYYQGPVSNWPDDIQDITIKSFSGTWDGTVVSGYGAFRAFDLSSVPAGIRGAIDGIKITAGTTADAGGGVLLPTGSGIILRNCLIEGNSAGSGGGACNGKAVNCTFSNNIAVKGGGAYDCAVEGCAFLGNSAEAGGGAYMKRSNINAVNCIFADNLGGGIYLDSDASIINCTFNNNRPFNIFTNKGEATIVNCISWNGDIDKADGMTNSVSYSDIQGGKYDSLKNNLSSDPKFASTSNNDLSLSFGSPCINAGVRGMGVPRTDMNGRYRLADVDIGAYEYSDLGLRLVQPSKYGTSVNAGRAYTITWSAADRSGNPVNYPYASLYFSSDGGQTWQTIEENFSPKKGNSYQWKAPLMLSNKCRIAVEIGRASREPLSRAESAYDFAIIDNVPPDITPGEIPRYVGSSVDISWEAADIIPAASPVKLELSTDGGYEWKVLADKLPMSGVFSFSPEPGMNIDYPLCRIRISVSDLAGNISSKEIPFGIDTRPPSIELMVKQGPMPRIGILNIKPFDENGIKKITYNNGYSGSWFEFPAASVPPRIILAPPLIGTYIITLEAYDMSDNYSIVTKTIELSLPETPEVASILIDGADASRIKSLPLSFKVKAEIDDHGSDLTSVKFTVSAGGKDYGAVATPERSAGDVTHYSASSKIDIPEIASSFYVVAEAYDGQGNMSAFNAAPKVIHGAVAIGGKIKAVPSSFRPGLGEAVAIKYSLTLDSDIKLVIRDAKGNLLWQRTFSPGVAGGKKGDNNIFWNGRNETGQYAGKGTHMCAIYSGGKQLAKGQIIVTE